MLIFKQIKEMERDMMKKFSFIVLSFIFSAMLTNGVLADTLMRYRAKSIADGNYVYFDSFNIEGANYFSIRDIAYLLNDTENLFNIKLEGDDTISINKNEHYNVEGTEFNKSVGRKKIKSGCEEIKIKSDGYIYNIKAYNINDRNYVLLRDICDILNISIDWDTERKVIMLKSIEFYNEIDISILPPVIVDKNRPMVALTFDDGPSANTERVLDVLEKYNGMATFFVTGNNILKYKTTLKRIVDEESQIGNHTYDHIRLTKVSAKEINNQVNRIQEIVYEATGVYPTFLRPPYGEYNDFVKDNVSIKMINWNVDTLDWKTRNAQNTYDEVMKNLNDGNVILMHDLYSETADAVEKIVPELVKRGYQLVSVEQLCYARDNVKGIIKY